MCVLGEDGLDKNSWLHFQVMSNELATPRILVCPADASKQAALDFNHLQEVNVTYQVHSGTNVTEVDPQSILAICPIHRNVLFCDGSVSQLSESQMRELLNSLKQHQ